MVIFRFEGDKIVEMKEFVDSAYVLSVQEKMRPKVSSGLLAEKPLQVGLIRGCRSIVEWWTVSKPH